MKISNQCSHCNFVSVTFNPFWDLSLPIPPGVKSTDLNECLAIFLKEEIMDGENMIECSNCKGKRKGIRRTSIEMLPKILVIRILLPVLSYLWNVMIKFFIKFRILFKILIFWRTKTDLEYILITWTWIVHLSTVFCVPKTHIFAN